jgi:hypothetical protein
VIRRLWSFLPAGFRDRSWRFLASNKEMFHRMRGGSAVCLVRERPEGLVRIDVFDPLRMPRRLSCVVPRDNMFLVSEVFAKRYCVEFFPEIHAHFRRQGYRKPLIVDAGANVGIFSRFPKRPSAATAPARSRSSRWRAISIFCARISRRAGTPSTSSISPSARGPKTDGA